MRQQTYDLMDSLKEKYYGYIGTSDLLHEGLTNRQIALMQEEGYLEKIANGHFWMPKCGLEKPADYKAVEVALVNQSAVIIADSACYYHGLIDVEPPVLSIATKRTDRHKMQFPFPVSRHYLSEGKFDEEKELIETPFGSYQIYGIDRSVSECIRFRDDIDSATFDLIIENYQKKYADEARKMRMFAYARSMKFEARMRKVLK